MKLRVEATAVVDRPPEEVWDHLMREGTSAAQEGRRPLPRVGEIAREEIDLLGRREVTWRLTELVEPRRLAIRADSGRHRVDVRTELAPQGRATRVTQAFELDTNPLLWLVARVARGKLEGFAQQGLRDSLKGLDPVASGA